MKKIILFIVASYSFILSATNYYVSSSDGADNKTGKSVSEAWKTIAKVNNSMSVFAPGDSILFKCGDSFTEQLNVTKSGTSTLPIVFGSYGTGSKPVINTAVTLTGWTVTTNPNIWVANYTGALSDVRFVMINDKIQQIGRYPDVTAPNDGFLYNDDCWGYTKFRDATLTVANQDWTGADAVIYTKPWKIEITKILKHIQDTVFTIPTISLISKGYGYFIQNHLATLTTQGEWFYDKTAKKIYLYSTYNPSTINIQASSTKYGVLFNSGITGVDIKNFSFKNIDSIAVSIPKGNYINISNCNFSNSLYGVWMPYCNSVNVLNNIFKYITAISVGSYYSTTTNLKIIGNVVKNNAMIPGMADSNNSSLKAAISIYSTSATISYNIVDSCGYSGIQFFGWGNTISHNNVSRFNMKEVDGGGIYTFGTQSYVSSFGINKYGNNQIENNYVHDGIGYLLGSNISDGFNRRPGIFCDGMTEYNTVRKNVLFNTNGIYLQSGTHHHIVTENTIYNTDSFNLKHPDIPSIYNEVTSAYQTISKNTFYNITAKINFNPYMGFSIGRANDTIPPMTNQGFSMTKNIIYSSRYSRQTPLSFTYGFKNYKQLFGVCDSNYYWQPFALDTIVATAVDSGYTKTRRLAYGKNYWKQNFEPNSVFRIAEYPYTTSAPGTNLFASNSAFNTNTNGWSYDYENVTNPGGWVSSGGLDGGCALLDLSNANTSPVFLSSVRFYRMIGTVNEGDVYILKFSAISNSNIANLCINYVNTTGTNPKMYTTSTARKEYIIPITFNDNAGGIGQYLYFTLHDKGTKVWLDNISIQKVTVNQTTPAAVMRFDVNPTDNPMQINLGTTTYKDVYGSVYSSTYTLEPYGSRILQNCSLTNINPITDNLTTDRLLVCPTPNANSEPLKLMIYSAVSKISNIRILSISGEIIYSRPIHINEGMTEINLPSLKRGLYLLESISSEGKSVVTKFMQ